MPLRFHEVNKPSREKKKQIAEELWVQYEKYIEEELGKGITVPDIAYRIKTKLIPGFTPTVRQLRHRMQNRRKTGQDLTRQIICSTRVMANGPPEPTMSNNQFIDSGDQNLLLPSGMHSQTSFENKPMELDSSGRESFSTLCTYLGTAPASTRYGASSDLPTLNPSFLPHYFTNNPDEILPFNHNLSMPNSFNTRRSSPLAISDNLTTQAVALSQGGSPSPSNSDMNRPIFLSEERNTHNTQIFRDLALQMIENNLLTGATFDAKSLQFMKLIPAEAAEHILPRDLKDPRNIEASQKTFWLSIKVRNCGLILGLFQLGLVRTPNMINAAYDLAMRCQDLKLVEHLVGSDVNLGTYDPFAGSIIHDHFSDIGVEATSDPWDDWHRKRQQGDFYVSSLEFASMQQNLPLVQLLLQNKANPETRPPNGSKYEASLDSVPINPLYCAISGQIPIRSTGNPGIVLDSGISQSIVRILIDTEAEVDSSAFIFTDSERQRKFMRTPGLEFTPIYIAASRGEVEIVKYLLTSGAQIKKKSPGQLALLGLLANSDHINGSDLFDIAKLLIDSGIDIHLTEGCFILHNCKLGLDLCSRNAIDLAYQFAQMEIIRLLHDNGAIAGERTLLFAIRGANSILIHELLSSTVTSKIFILAILEAFIQKMEDVVLAVLYFTRAKYGLELEKLIVEEDDVSDFMECIATAIELEYEDIARQLISIAEALPSMPGMRAHFQATCVAARNNWSNTHAHNLFKVAKYPKNIWDMKKKDWWKLCRRSKLKSPLEPWNWNSGIIKILLDHKIYPTSSGAMTLAILVCARDGVEELVKRLFNLASEELLIDVPASDGQIREFMERYDMQRRSRTNNKCPFLSDAVFAGHFKIAELLLKNGFPIDDAGFNIALQKGNFNLFSQFIHAHAGWNRKIDVEDSSIPILCAEEGKLLWDNKLLPARNGIYISPVPLARWAISNGSLNLLMTILGWFSRDDVASSDSLLNEAVELRAHEILERILLFIKERGNIPRENFGLAALIRAVEGADIKSTCSLLAFGVWPLTLYRSVTGRSSVLSLAIEKHSPDRQELLPEILEFIYDKGDIVEERDGMYNTALLTAVAVDNLYSVELLINSKFEVNHLPTRMTPRTPLQAACCCSSRAMVNFLLEKGADVNAPAFEFRGGTALQFAVIRGDSEIVKDLLRWDADVNAPGAEFGGRTAVEAAAEHGRVHILESYLLRPGSWDGEFGKRQFERARKLAKLNKRMTVEWVLDRSRRGRVGLLQPGEQGGVHPQLV